VYMFLSHHQIKGQNHNIKTANKLFENVTEFMYLTMTVTNQNFIHKAADAICGILLPCNSDSFVIPACI
jgi:hypothetical protein